MTTSSGDSPGSLTPPRWRYFPLAPLSASALSDLDSGGFGLAGLGLAGLGGLPGRWGLGSWVDPPCVGAPPREELVTRSEAVGRVDGRRPGIPPFSAPTTPSASDPTLQASDPADPDPPDPVPPARDALEPDPPAVGAPEREGSPGSRAAPWAVHSFLGDQGPGEGHGDQPGPRPTPPTGPRLGRAEGGHGRGLAGQLVRGWRGGGGLEEPGHGGIGRGRVQGIQATGQEPLGGVVVERVDRGPRIVRHLSREHVGGPHSVTRPPGPARPRRAARRGGGGPGGRGPGRCRGACR
jgi:translation initiation factor IF-2